MKLKDRLRHLALGGSLRPIDAEFGIRLGELGGADGHFDDALCLTALLASRAIGEGHSCIPVAELGAARDRFAGEFDLPDLPDHAALAEALARSAAVARDSAHDLRPLLVDDQRLYLDRYARHEAESATRLAALLAQPADAIATHRLRPGAPGYLFEEADRKLAGETNWQAVACAVALRHKLSVLSGGPGTGKTYTLALIALLLLERARKLQPEKPYRVALAAPTGKAAQRLREAVKNALGQFREAFADAVDEQDLDYVSNSGKTLHRLLGARPDQIEFRHDERNPIEADCLIIDECSMIDLPLMTRTLRALKPGARLVLVGDRQQLFPVEAGNVFSELFWLCEANRFDPASCQAVRDACGIALDPPEHEGQPLSGHVTVLEYSFRADEEVNDFGRSVQQIGRGFAAARQIAERVPDRASGHAVVRTSVPYERLARTVLERCGGEQGWFAALRRSENPAAALQALGRFRILCALRRGPHGVAALNIAVEAALKALQPAADFSSQYYHLRPILITRNAFRLKLYNGDVGIIFHQADENGVLRPRAFFEATDESEQALRGFLPTQLPPHETCYAMTIHKSQGSEFDQVAVVLPHDETGPSPILSRELVYTAVTRARSAVEIWSPAPVLAQALAVESLRFSGLAPRMMRPVR